MDVFYVMLFLSTLLCSLVAGFLFAFTVVVMPGFKSLNKKEFIKAFQIMDDIIQKRQPLFMAVCYYQISNLCFTEKVQISKIY